MDASKLIELRRQAAEVYRSRANPSDSSLHTYNLRVKAAAQQYSAATLSQTQGNPNFIPSNATSCCLTPAGFTSAASPGVNSYPSSRLQGGSAGGRTMTYDGITSRAAGLAVCCGPTPPPAEPAGIYYSTCCYDERLPSSTYTPPCKPGYNQTPHFVQPPPPAMVFGVDCCPSSNA